MEMEIVNSENDECSGSATTVNTNNWVSGPQKACHVLYYVNNVYLLRTIQI